MLYLIVVFDKILRDLFCTCFFLFVNVCNCLLILYDYSFVMPSLYTIPINV